MPDLQERLKDPRRFVINLKINLDDLKERLVSAFYNKKQNMFNELRQLELRIEHQSPLIKIKERKVLLKNIQKDLFSNFSFRLTTFKERLHKDSALLESLSPLAVMQRGYSITSNVNTGLIIRQTDDLSVGDDVNVRLARGNFNAKIEKIF